MSWNHRSRVVAMAVALQVSAGTFVQPSSANDIMAVASISNQHNPLTADDPTQTGAIWDANSIYLGETATLGASFPMRGPGGAQPPAVNTWPIGKVLQTGGWAETRKATSTAATLQAGSTTTALVLANTESAVDDSLVGAPIQQATIGSGFQQTSLIVDYAGASKTATIAETMGSAPATGANYTIPPFLLYQLGTLTTPPPVASISVWRDKKRYDYRDWAPTSIAINMPVANEQNTSFPDITFSGTGTVQAIVDDTTPTLPSSMLQVAVPPCRNGKFYLDRVKLGHQSLSFTETPSVGAASNQNQAAGQDARDIIGGTRATSIDLNQMNVSDFDLHARQAAQTVMPVMSTWGMGPGNNWGFSQPNIAIRGFSPGDRNGYVNLAGDAVTTDIDKSATLVLWW